MQINLQLYLCPSHGLVTRFRYLGEEVSQKTIGCSQPQGSSSSFTTLAAIQKEILTDYLTAQLSDRYGAVQDSVQMAKLRKGMTTGIPFSMTTNVIYRMMTP
jgi:hypothetical protein